MIYLTQLTRNIFQQSMWQASRWLFLLMVGLPAVIISMLCYGLCCLEAADDVPEYEEDEEGGEEDKLYDAPPPLITQRLLEGQPPFG